MRQKYDTLNADDNTRTYTSTADNTRMDFSKFSRPTMKFFIVAALLAATTAASLAAPQPAWRVVYTKRATEGDGSYGFSFQTPDGAQFEQAQGEPYCGTTEDGRPYCIYNGQPYFLDQRWQAPLKMGQTRGEHLPTTPPMPEALA